MIDPSIGLFFFVFFVAIGESLFFKSIINPSKLPRQSVGWKRSAWANWRNIARTTRCPKNAVKTGPGGLKWLVKNGDFNGDI